MRLDKFLKNARLIKRRTLAREACDRGLVTIDGRVAKAGSEVQPGQIIELSISQPPLTIEVQKLEEHVKKEEAASLYRVCP